jgi:hypothetical protein
MIRPVKLKSLGMPTKLDYNEFQNFKTFDYSISGDLEDPEITSFVTQFKF